MNKSLTIRSTSGNPADTIVQAANPDDHVFEITADYVNISGFKVTGATGWKAGIYLGSVEHCNISSNKVTNNWRGIWLHYYSNSNTITGNTASNNIHGIYLTSSSNYNTLTNNNASNTYYGIRLEYSSNNNLTNNTANSNNIHGIWLYSSSNNIIYLNNFINNSDNVYSSGSTNIYNSTSKITYTYNGSEFENYLGNYWDDYTGSDADGDGIGDTPYSVYSADKDNYPLMERFENYFAPQSEQPQLKAPWKGTAKISQGNNGSSHKDYGTWDNTYAIDVALPVGSDVLAPADGVVKYVDNDPSGAGGKELALEHTGPTGKKFVTVYLHLSDILVEEGDFVKQGQVVAKSGATGDVTGPHLHFHMWKPKGSEPEWAYDSHTMPIERLVMKQVGVDSDFREYDARKGELDDDKIAGKLFESNNAPLTKPTAIAGGPYYGNVNEDIQFNGDGTAAKGRTIEAWEWTFYDRDTVEKVTEQNPTHTWSTAGAHLAMLRVQDSVGLWSDSNVCMVFISDSLIEKYAPVLYFHKDEKFYPTEIEALLDHSDLKDKNGEDLKKGPVTVDDLMAHNDEDNYLDMTLINSEEIKDKKSPDPSYFTEYPSNIYVRKEVVYGGTVLQYWFFYPYNQGTINAHEGDWEMFQITLDSNEKPDRVTCSWHEPILDIVFGGKTYEWSEVEKIGGTHPKVYVNRGSHANNVEIKLFFQVGKIIHPKGVDVPESNKEELDYLTIIDDQTKWVNWKGKWGQQVGISGFNGVSGPMYRTDQGFNVWKYPLSWMFLYDLWGYRVFPHSPVNIHIFDQYNNHVGLTDNGTFESEISGVYYVDLDSEREIYISNTSNEYRIFVESTEEGKFGLDIEQKKENETTMTQYQNVSITQNTTANVSINQTTTNYTMEIDQDGDGTIDERKDPDLFETDYAPTATIISPVNNSIYLYGDKIAFNGTGTDLEDGILANSSLVWSSSIDGCIGIGSGFNTTNLSAGTHIIELMVNDSSGQIDTDNVTIEVIASDLAIDTSNISFSNPYPIEGENVMINATIHNIGTANATNVTVQFFDGNPMIGTQIGANQTIAAINAGENKAVSVVWNTTGEAGDNRIWVVVDPSDSVKESDEGNNQANKSIFVGAPNILHILHARTDRAVYLENEEVLISCIVQNASGNISANVSADIEKPDGIMDNITLMEGLLGNYNGTFANTSLSGTYNITIYANRTGFIDDNESLSFEVLDTTPPASITNITHTTGSTWINWTWDNPNDPDFDHTLIYLNGTWKTATSNNYYLAEGLNASTEYEIETRTVDTEGNINETWVNQTAKTSENEPPTANFTYSPENPIVDETITFNASNSTDPDGNITNYEWDFGDGNITNTTEEIITYSYASAGDYIVNLTVTDDDGATNSISKTITILPLEKPIFDTGAPANPYPSIFGVHNGTITPSCCNITVNKLYTYPCAGTGGHIEYALIWNLTWNVTAHWNGYVGDWQNITFDEPFTLCAGNTYNYTIRTGSYPQIHHTNALPTENGWINCTSFVDANGKVYDDWIPAIRLWMG